MYSLGDKSKNAKAEIIHIEGDPDHPVNRGTLCPKGAGLLDFVRAKTRTKYPLHRKPGSDKWERVSWDFALDRIAKLMKEDRDANLITQNAAGQTVNRWVSTGMLAASATTNETARLTWKTVRSLGMVVFDNQARV
jgi:formate dehydrogenase major subunit